jgi:glycosyltransferase involved in cell wall biosynthesis
VSAVRIGALLASVPIVGAAATLALGAPAAAVVFVLVLLAMLWGLFVVQLLSGQSGRAFMAYGRLRLAALRHGHPDDGGAERTLGPARPAWRGLPRLAWSHDGWAHADGHLGALELLSEWFDITAFGTESRWRGEPPVPLELLPAIPYGAGIKLRGLEERLRDFDVAWTGGSFEGTTWQALDARAQGGPAVVSLEVENVVGNYGGPGNPLRERSVREVDHFCATSTAAAALLMLEGVEESRVSLVPMVVDIPDADEARVAEMRRGRRAESGFGERDVVALYLGRLIPDKGVNTLVGALAWARRWPEGARLRLLIAGDGEAGDDLRRIVAGYGLGDVVEFTGSVGPDERRRLLAASDLLVLPSLAVPGWLEQFGRVMPEAFAFGLPVVGAMSGAIPEVIGDAGRVYAPGDFGALAGALLELAHDEPRFALASRARRRAQLYTAEAFAARMRDALMLGIEHRERFRRSA